MRKTTLCMLTMIMVCPLTSGMGCVGADDAGVPPEGGRSPGKEVTPDYDLTGAWGDATISQSGDSLTVSMPDRGPFDGWYTDPDTIEVSFVDDPGCCTGDISGGGEVIRWSNGTTWVKDT